MVVGKLKILIFIKKNPHLPLPNIFTLHEDKGGMESPPSPLELIIDLPMATNVRFHPTDMPLILGWFVSGYAGPTGILKNWDVSLDVHRGGIFSFKKYASFKRVLKNSTLAFRNFNNLSIISMF